MLIKQADSNRLGVWCQSAYDPEVSSALQLSRHWDLHPANCFACQRIVDCSLWGLLSVAGSPDEDDGCAMVGPCVPFRGGGRDCSLAAWREEGAPHMQAGQVEDREAIGGCPEDDRRFVWAHAAWLAAQFHMVCDLWALGHCARCCVQRHKMRRSSLLDRITRCQC